MDRMLYVAMSGAKETLLAQANNNHNLANVNTPGFMQDLNQFRSMPVFGSGYPTRVYAMDERPDISFIKGSLQSTGNDLDLAVKGAGFIAVQAPDGTEAYTRRGDLKVDANGMLSNGEGLPVIGNGGPISLPPHEQIEIGSDGTITILPLGATPEALAVVDRIKLVNPPMQEMMKGEDGLMRMKDGAEAEADAAMELVSGALESSNVNIADALVNMIELSRRFEMQVKMMKNAQELDAASATLLRQA
ncbi:flagellar basal body rod protein FlgF [Candidatus Endoriftia persephone str. Guaymas]|jgi:flagellar basal-body rod protein FlgF|uniref:Flagellar basal-body rod protein FlgF n=4 Tax=Gammaproteobacteria TaxID=1236 RepID=G2FB44_9GAMM|nr:flagellar basal-body rod protein FlgF [Candidatus Endoriftia persephone]MBA1330251.1 flagellar basal body rod protein FlgF [Candidatus Endoriftia persephone str. Guaymas]EGV51086.1 flagellar basal-body rod protein flgF [endosymbiont of Riftia pachyptila (vent Ph05)]EGW55982.1 flagellar basal-body rod protein FlgF [endosymbiont of Tevnia jerichonana (vent Tica)]KRT56297.1 flagellar basal-body rod protein FlgF [endosymbiont of Ridgeia piscesae]KRT58811.1 flagellar basal-body rod protein FlgF 